MSVKPLISAADYNNIRNKINRILGPGVGSEGYGQILQSQPINPLAPPPANNITADQWNLLRNDIVTIRQHQIGESGNIPTVTRGATIRTGISNPVNGFDLILNQLLETRFNVGSNRVSILPRVSEEFTGVWSEKALCTLTVTFETSDLARYFFNSGGQIRFNSSRVGGSPTPQNNAWSQALASAGPRLFGANLLEPVNFYTLTDQYQTFFIFSASTPYSANIYKLSAKSNKENNSQGTANVLTFKIEWQDNYTDPDIENPDFPGPGTVFNGGDEVDGTLSITIEEIKETFFLLSSPTYSISPITVDPEE
jgi:hypothetical protein